MSGCDVEAEATSSSAKSLLPPPTKAGRTRGVLILDAGEGVMLMKSPKLNGGLGVVEPERL